MAWQRNYVTLTSGDRVRYSLIKRPDSGVYNVRFKSPEMRYYTATEKKQTADEVLGGLQGRLLPKKKTDPEKPGPTAGV